MESCEIAGPVGSPTPWGEHKIWAASPCATPPLLLLLPIMNMSRGSMRDERLITGQFPGTLARDRDFPPTPAELAEASEAGRYLRKVTMSSRGNDAKSVSPFPFSFFFSFFPSSSRLPCYKTTRRNKASGVTFSPIRRFGLDAAYIFCRHSCDTPNATPVQKSGNVEGGEKGGQGPKLEER